MTKTNSEVANMTIEELIKTKGQEFLKRILPEDADITDKDWDEVLKAPDIAENIKIYKEDDGSDDSFMAGFMVGLSAGVRYGIITMAVMISKYDVMNDILENDN